VGLQESKNPLEGLLEPPKSNLAAWERFKKIHGDGKKTGRGGKPDDLPSGLPGFDHVFFSIPV